MSLLVALAMSVCTNSCITAGTDNADSVVMRLKTYNDKLPLTFSNDDMLDSVYYDGGSHKAVFNYLVNNDEVTIESLIADGKAAKDYVVKHLLENADAISLYKEIAGYEVEVRTILLDGRGRLNTQVDLTLDEIKKLHSQGKIQKPAQAMTARDSLDQLVDSINALCPDSIESKLELNRVQIENNYLVFNYVCNETKSMKIDMMKGDLGRWKTRVDRDIAAPTPEFKHLMELCVDNGLGIKYRYVGRLTKQAEDYAKSATTLSKATRRPLPEGYEEIKERTGKDARIKKATKAVQGQIF